MSYKNILSYKSEVEKELEKRLSAKNAPEILKKSMLYSLSAGGKRIRPCLMLEFYRCLGGEMNDILNFACAVEMIHTYSLIHDDLPCMDDDDLRRGKPSNHKVFGEDIALLAGDALLTFAFETACDINKSIKPERALKAVKYIADAAGLEKMVGGQVLDLQVENKQISIEELEQIQEGKTAALLKVNAYVACALANADEKTTKLFVEYCDFLGRAFQIRDDILDVIGDEESLGKPIGSDEQMNKNTYVSLLGLEKSQELVEKLTNSAINAIKQATLDNENLCSLALKLAERKN